MNDNIQENILETTENQEINKEDNTTSENQDKENQENNTIVDPNSETNLQTYSIVIDGKESNYLIETYKEMKITNMYLSLILISIVLIYVLNKFYYYFKNIFTIKF